MADYQEIVLDSLAVVASLTYFLVAYVQSRRHVSDEALRARNAFILWWAGLGGIGIFGLVFSNFVDVGSLSLNTFRVIIYPIIALLLAMVAGLAFYMLYLYTGRKDTLRWVMLFYALLFVFYIWLVEAHDPFIGADPETGEPGLQQGDPAPDWVSGLLGLALILPPFAAAVSYGLLFFRTRDKTARFRIALVSMGFVLWFGYSLLGSVSGLLGNEVEQTFARQLTSQILGLFAAALVLLAYYPPRVVRERFGLRVVGEEEMPKGLDRREVFEPERRQLRGPALTPHDLPS